MITEEEVLKIAKLSKLSLEDSEVKLFSEQLGKILDYVELLNELDTKDVPPTARVIPSNNVLRDDLVKPGLSSEEIFSNAPENEKNMFKVPKI